MDVNHLFLFAQRAYERTDRPRTLNMELSPIHMAAYYGAEKMAKELLCRGATNSLCKKFVKVRRLFLRNADFLVFYHCSHFFLKERNVCRKMLLNIRR